MGSATSSPQTYPGQRGAPSSSATTPRQPSSSAPGRVTMPSAPPQTGSLAPVHFNSSGDRVVIRGSRVGQPPSAAPLATAPASGGVSTQIGSSNNIAASSTNDTSRPGAYAVSRSATGPAQVFRVTVPPGVSPGSEFSVHAGSRRVRVRCPPTSSPGQSLQITLPPEPLVSTQLLKVAPLTAARGPGGGGTVLMTPEVANVNRAAATTGGTAQTFLVTIPANIYPGMQFTASIEGQRFMVTCPPNAGPNMKVRIVPPTQRDEPEAAPKTQVFEVVVPPGVHPNQPFTLMANGQRVLVTCPPNVVPGQKIRFQLPVQQAVGNIHLSYEGDSGGWCRTIRVTDLKFQWVRVRKNDIVADDAKFDFYQAAYVRKLSFLEGNDTRMRTGILELVPASEAAVDSKLVVQNSTLVSYADIAVVQGKTLQEKINWFTNICQQLTGSWEEGHVKICVRRASLLQDSVDAVMSLGREDMRKRWRIEFLGEGDVGIDAGGLTREWFECISEQMLDPDRGLWLSSVQNQLCVTINPASHISCPDDHLVYFRFLGRIMGRALFDKQLMKGHMVRHMYKHLLGWPVTFEDLEHEDETYYRSLKKLADMEDVSVIGLDFTVTEQTMGVHTEVALVEKGDMMPVTNENLDVYLEANLKYRMLERIKPQMTELLLGFFDIIPEPCLTVFDFQELELLLCGVPSIDIDDWEQNTIYSGMFESKGRTAKAVTWFWEIVRNDFDQEMRARLLQFVTGTSGVPARGFSVLQGNDGNIKKFAIHGVSSSTYPYPRSHTCFNRIDLPNYASKKDMFEKLKVAVTFAAVGFGIE